MRKHLLGSGETAKKRETGRKCIANEEIGLMLLREPKTGRLLLLIKFKNLSLLKML